MKRLPLVLLMILGAALPAFAGQKGDRAEAADSPADKGSPIIRFQVPTVEADGIISYRQIKSTPGFKMPVGGWPPTSSDTAFVIADGAVYIAMPGTGVLVPMSGGGASGCFTLDLPQRVENLRRVIEQLPLKIGGEPATRQLEAYAM